MMIFAYTGLFNQVYAKRNEANIRQEMQKSRFAAAAGTDKCGNGVVCDLHIYIFQCVVLSIMEI